MSETGTVTAPEGVAKVLLEVANERAHQRDRGWTPEHDDHHGPVEWVSLLAREVGTVGYTAVHPEPWWVALRDRVRCSMPDLGPSYRRALVRVAAIAVAAIESYDRRANP